MIGAFEKRKAVRNWAEGKEVTWYKTLDEMLAAARRGELTAVAVENVASVAQTAIQLDRLLTDLEELKVAFNLVEEGWSPTARRVVASLASAERSMHSERQREAAERKRERVEKGEDTAARFGPKGPSKLLPEVRAKIYEMKDADMSVSEIARQLKLSRPTVYKALEERGEQAT